MDNGFEGNQYDFNDFKGDDFSNESKAYGSRLVDIRIVLTDKRYLEFISKAVSNFDLSNFNVNISSIIPTDNIKIAESAIAGADLVLIACEDDENGNQMYQNFKNSLRNEMNFIEYLKLPSLEELNGYGYDGYDDENVLEDEIANSIIRGGLYSISNLSSINNSKKKYYLIKKNFEEESLKHEKTLKENEILIVESKSLREKNEKLLEELKALQRQLDAIRSDFSDLKSRFEGVYSKNSLEVFSLDDLWHELFNEHLSQDVYKFILICTDNFRPKNLMIGQGAICADSKEDALDWLKIIKTAFILSDTNKQELDFNNFNSNFIFDEIEEFVPSSDYKISENASDYGLSEGRNGLNDVNSIFNDLDDSFFGKSVFADDDNVEKSSFFGKSVFADDDNVEKSSFFGKSVFADDDNVEKSIDSSDDGFIYNERFEGHSNLENHSINGTSIGDKSRVDGNGGINVFNLKSLKSMEEEEDSPLDDEMENYDGNSYNEDGYTENNDDYDYDDESIDEDDDEEIYSAFSNFWGE